MTWVNYSRQITQQTNYQNPELLLHKYVIVNSWANIRTYLKIAALADTALKMNSKCSFTTV